MRLVITIDEIDPKVHVIGTGPKDAEGIPTCTLADYEAAIRKSNAGERGYVGRAEYFPNFPDMTGGITTAYMLPAGINNRPGGVEDVLDELRLAIVDGGVLREKQARTKEPWMLLDQETIDRLDEQVWLDYKAGRCLCAAHEKGECACGAWCKCGAITGSRRNK